MPLGDRTILASMGPRTSIRGNLPMSAFAKTAKTASMGPRTSIRGNNRARATAPGPHRASMGPRTSIRGNERQDEVKHQRTPRFNGAADFHPRKHPSSPSFSWSFACFNGAADFHPRKQHAFEVFSCQRLALPLASAGRQTVDWTKRTLVPNPQLHACQHLPAASGHRVFALTSTLAPAAKAAHRVSNPW